MNASLKFRVSFMPTLIAAVLFTLGCSASGGNGGSGGGGGSGGAPQLTIVTRTPLPEALVNQPYNVTLQASGGTPPYTWSMPPGLANLPQGIVLSASGVLSGTPPPQSLEFAGGLFQVQDAKGLTASTQLELVCAAPLTFNMASGLADGNIAIPYYLYLPMNGGIQPYTFTLAPGSDAMPPGITLDPVPSGEGLIQGTPAKPGAYKFVVQATDSGTTQMKVTQSFTLNVLNNLVMSSLTLPDAVLSDAYLEQLQPAGGAPPYHFSLNTPMPPGLTLDGATGVVSGTPTVSDHFSVNLNVTDSAAPPATIRPYVDLTVQPRLKIETASLPDSARGLNYGGTIYVSGGRAPYHIQVTNGMLPNGLTASVGNYASIFDVAGAPTMDGLFKFTIQVSDSYETPNTASFDSQIRISDQMAISGPTQAQILYNQSYSATFPVTGGFPPYKWKFGPVPPGFTFDPLTGTLSGTPNGGAGTSSEIIAQDSSNPPLQTNYATFTLIVFSKLGILTSSLPTISTGANTTLAPTATGGSLPYQWSVSSGSLPPGMVVNSTNGGSTISGTATSAGSYTFSLSVSDGNSGNLHQTTSQPITWTVKNPAQMMRSDTVAQATPVSNIYLLASISPFSDSGSAGADVDVYSMSAAPGAIVQVYADANNDFIQPPEPNSLFPVLEIVDSTGNRYQTCSFNYQIWTTIFNSQCVNGLNGAAFSKQVGFAFQVPGTGTAPVTFYVRVSDARGDARPDFIYTFTAYGVD